MSWHGLGYNRNFLHIIAPICRIAEHLRRMDISHDIIYIAFVHNNFRQSWLDKQIIEFFEGKRILHIDSHNLRAWYNAIAYLDIRKIECILKDFHLRIQFLFVFSILDTWLNEIIQIDFAKSFIWSFFIDSYSKYIEYPEFEEYITKHINGEWIGKVNEIKTRLQRGKEIAEQINILGDDGVPVEYHVTFWKSELIDFVILQQDAFDEIDAVTPMERQEEILNMVIEICHTEFEFDNFNEVMDYFKKMINICKQMNYSKFKSEEYDKFHKQLQELVEERKA